MVTRLFINFSNAQGQLSQNLMKFKFIQAFMVVLVTCKSEEDLSKNEGSREVATFLPLCLWGFFKRSGAANSSVPGLIMTNFEHIRDFMIVLVTYKNEEDSSKNEGSRVVTTVLPL